jgi:hypothetical protein
MPQHDQDVFDTGCYALVERVRCACAKYRLLEITVQNTHLDRITPHEQPVQGFEAAVRRAEAEFREMPGLKLTEAQAARLWSFDAQVASAVLSRLTESFFLVRTRTGSFCRS